MPAANLAPAAAVAPTLMPVDPETLPDLRECARCDGTHDGSELKNGLCEECRPHVVEELAQLRERVELLEKILGVRFHAPSEPIPERPSWGDVLHAITDCFGAAPITAKNMVAFAKGTQKHAPELLDRLAGFLRMPTRRVNARMLEKALMNCTGARSASAGLRLVDGVPCASGRTWRVILAPPKRKP